MSIFIKQAYAEVDMFINLLGEEYTNKLPMRLREFFSREKDKEYGEKIDINSLIKKQEFKEETLAIIAFLNLKYWCEDQEEKEKLIAIYKKNEEIYQKEISEKYNVDDLFKNKKTINIVKKNTDEKALEVYKETIWRKIFNKIKSFFRR